MEPIDRRGENEVVGVNKVLFGWLLIFFSLILLILSDIGEKGYQ